MMTLRQPLPRLWLMTDERVGDALWAALQALPHGSGVIFRHYATPPAERRWLFERVRAVARRRRLILVLAGSPRQAIAWRADGAHGRSRHHGEARMVRTVPAHDRGELVAAIRAGADLVFLSPVFATRSHPGAAALGPIRFGLTVGRIHRRPSNPSPLRRQGSMSLTPKDSYRSGDMGPCLRRGDGVGKTRIVALGGMDARRFRSLRALGAYGWAAIDALSRDQNLKVVPR